MTLLYHAIEEIDDELPSPHALSLEIPCNSEHQAFVARARRTIINILSGKDSRLLLVVGPCSIHDPAATLEYASRLIQLQKQVEDRFFLVMRTYLEKPRTILGWKGFLYDPDLDGSYDVAKGIRLSRSLLVDLTEMGIPCASELLELTTSQFYADFLAWGCIGARTTSSQPHRQLAASCQFPVGFKNSTDGNIDHPIHGVLAAKSAHTYLGLSHTGKLAPMYTKGNPYCHIVLRGAESQPNYDRKSIEETIKRCQNSGISPKLLVDCSHDNCNKDFRNQPIAFQSLMEQIREGNKNIMGAMLESNLYEGHQPITSQLTYGVSITDSCLDWETTKRLILEAI